MPDSESRDPNHPISNSAMDNLRSSNQKMVPLEIARSVEVPSAKDLVKKRPGKISPRGSENQVSGSPSGSPIKGSSDSPYAHATQSKKTSGRKKQLSISSKPSEAEAVVS